MRRRTSLSRALKANPDKIWDEAKQARTLNYQRPYPRRLLYANNDTSSERRSGIRVFAQHTIEI